jgi:PRC-barrel domain
MAWRLDIERLSRRAAAGCRRTRFTALQGGALVIAIAAAAGPSNGQAPAPVTRDMSATNASSAAPSIPDEGSSGSTEAPSAKGARLQRLSHDDLFRILGKEVRSASGQAMGRIVDILFDEAGRPRAAIIDFGGFLGVGTRKIAISWDSVHFAPAGPKEDVVVDLDRDQIKAAPEYKESREVVAVVSPPTSRQHDSAPDQGW